MDDTKYTDIKASRGFFDLVKLVEVLAERVSELEKHPDHSHKRLYEFALMTHELTNYEAKLIKREIKERLRNALMVYSAIEKEFGRK